MKEKKRGPKYPPGVGKRKILLIALNHPDGIGEEKLIDVIKEKLLFGKKADRGIKGHLDDLGPGRTVRDNWREGKQYLIKIPSKYEPIQIKKKLLRTLKTQGIEIDIDNLPEENSWKPNPDPDIFKTIYSEMQKENDILPFLNSKYAQRMMDCVAKEHTSLYEDNEAFEELKKMLKLSPKMFELCLTVDNLGRKFLMVSSKIDYYGISEIAFEKALSRTINYDFYYNVVFGEDGPYTNYENSESDDIMDPDPSIKHNIRWELFRSCLKTDISFLDKEKISEEIERMIAGENAKRARADAALKPRDVQTFRDIGYLVNRRWNAVSSVSLEEGLEELAEVMKNPEKYPEKIKELKEIAREGEELSGRYFFSWDSIPGNDNERLLRYLSDCLGIDWADADAKIHKSDDVKTIYISKDENSVEIRIDEENEKATITLKISNGITHELNPELKVKNENGKLNIYTYTPEL